MSSPKPQDALSYQPSLPNASPSGFQRSPAVSPIPMQSLGPPGQIPAHEGQSPRPHPSMHAHAARSQHESTRRGQPGDSRQQDEEGTGRGPSKIMNGLKRVGERPDCNCGAMHACSRRSGRCVVEAVCTPCCILLHALLHALGLFGRPGMFSLLVLARCSPYPTWHNPACCRCARRTMPCHAFTLNLCNTHAPAPAMSSVALWC